MRKLRYRTRHLTAPAQMIRPFDLSCDHEHLGPDQARWLA